MQTKQTNIRYISSAEEILSLLKIFHIKGCLWDIFNYLHLSSTFSKLARKFIDYREVRFTKWKAANAERDILNPFLADMKGSE